MLATLPAWLDLPIVATLPAWLDLPVIPISFLCHPERSRGISEQHCCDAPFHYPLFGRDAGSASVYPAALLVGAPPRGANLPENSPDNTSPHGVGLLHYFRSTGPLRHVVCFALLHGPGTVSGFDRAGTARFTLLQFYTTPILHSASPSPLLSPLLFFLLSSSFPSFFLVANLYPLTSNLLRRVPPHPLLWSSRPSRSSCRFISLPSLLKISHPAVSIYQLRQQETLYYDETT